MKKAWFFPDAENTKAMEEKEAMFMAKQQLTGQDSKDHTPGGAFLLSAVLSLKNRETALEGPEIRSILYAI